MHSNQYGQITRSDKEVIDLLYQNPNLDITKLNFDNISTVEQFNNSAKNCGIDIGIHIAENISTPIEDFDLQNQNNWFMPDEYKQLDIEGFLVNECPKENYQRLIEELEGFRQKNMLDLLRWCKYFVDTCRKNNIIWGVGRGSSVASYVLYLIGVHKINSIEHNLDFGEFLK